MREEYRDSIKKGIESAFPVVVGYFPVAVAFGILSKNIGVSFKETSLFSILVYAGASQFMALDLIQAGLGLGSIVLATFLLNLRHMMMTASLAYRFEDIDKAYIPLLAFGITDETFSVLSFTSKKLDLLFILIVNISSYSSWVIGTIMGYALGEVLSKSLQVSLGIGLYGLFASLLFPQFRKDKKPLVLASIAALVYSILFFSKILPLGWDIIIGILISSGLGVFIFGVDLKDAKETI